MFRISLDFLAGLCLAGASGISLLAATGPPAPLFDGQRALRQAERQCAFGPRSPLPAGGAGGRPSGHDRCREFLATELTRHAGAVQRQEFEWTLPAGVPVGAGAQLKMTNLIARFAPEKTERILLAAHWDTRPWADREEDPARRRLPIPGANDGASGVAVLLELARLLQAHPPPVGVDIAFFDGEDLGTEAHPEGFFRGSREYARRLGSSRPRHAILLDMVGDADLQFKREGYSARHAGPTLDWLWKAGRESAPDYFTEEPGTFVLDDHVPLLEAGVPCVDLIDFDYPHWHTTRDTPDKLSATSLQVVGDVLVRLIYPGTPGGP